MNIKKFNEEVYYGKCADAQAVAFLKQKAIENTLRRCRLCTHNDPSDVLHEMFIVHMHGNYIPPHSHHNSAESTLVLEGEGVMCFYDENGKVIDTIYLNADIDKGQNYLRTPIGKIHSLFIFSEYMLFKECILGPFDPANMHMPEWAPQEGNRMQIEKFLKSSEQSFRLARRMSCGG